MSKKPLRIGWIMCFFIVCLVFAPLRPVSAGIHPYAEFLPSLAHEARKILQNYDMPVASDREDPWFSISGIPGSYYIYLYRADEIPQQAVLDIVKLCMDFYEQRGRKERFRILVYHESKDEWRNSLFLGIGIFARVKPFFELTIGREE